MCRCDLRDAVTGRLELQHRALARRQRVERREQLHELGARRRRRRGRVGRHLHERQPSLCVGDAIVEREGVVAVSAGRHGMPPSFVQDRAPDPRVRERAERDAASVVEPVDRLDQPDHPGGHEILSLKLRHAAP
jgi:hypothetical protein